MSDPSNFQARSNPALGLRMGCAIVPIIFVAAGIFFISVIWKSMQPTMAEGQWPVTPCTIISSGVSPTTNSSGDSVYALHVDYRYVWQGVTHRSNVYERAYPGSTDFAGAQRIAARYPAGSAATCRVDPAHPDQAILQARSLGGCVALVVPLAFIVAGIVGILGLWRKGSGNGSRGRKAIAGALIAAGVLVFVLGTIPKFVQYFSAQRWPAVPCAIKSSRVGAHRGDKGGYTYSIDIIYDYQFAGRKFESAQYDLNSGSTAGYAAKKQVVDAHPRGSKWVCYVNPANPGIALLDRTFPWLAWVLLAIPLVLFAVAAATVAGPRRYGTGGPGASSSTPLPGFTSAEFSGRPGGSRGWQPKTPLGTFFFMLIFACFWNAFVIGMFYLFWRMRSHDAFDLIPAVFFAIFFLAGIFLIVATVYNFLALWRSPPESK